MSQGDESVVAEIPVFSKHKWLQTGLKSSGSNRNKIKGNNFVMVHCAEKGGNVLHTCLGLFLSSIISHRHNALQKIVAECQQF